MRCKQLSAADRVPWLKLFDCLLDKTPELTGKIGADQKSVLHLLAELKLESYLAKVLPHVGQTLNHKSAQAITPLQAAIASGSRAFSMQLLAAGGKMQVSTMAAAAELKQNEGVAEADRRDLNHILTHPNQVRDRLHFLRQVGSATNLASLQTYYTVRTHMDINFVDGHGEDALMLAARRGALDVVNWILTLNIDLARFAGRALNLPQVRNTHHTVRIAILEAIGDKAGIIDRKHYCYDELRNMRLQKMEAEMDRVDLKGARLRKEAKQAQQIQLRLTQDLQQADDMLEQAVDQRDHLLGVLQKVIPMLPPEKRNLVLQMMPAMEVEQKAALLEQSETTGHKPSFF